MKDVLAQTLSTAIAKLGPMPNKVGFHVRGLLSLSEPEPMLLALAGAAMEESMEKGNWLPLDKLMDHLAKARAPENER